MKKYDWRDFFFQHDCKYIFDEFTEPSDIQEDDDPDYDIGDNDDVDYTGDNGTDAAGKVVELLWIEYKRPYPTSGYFPYPQAGRLIMGYYDGNKPEDPDDTNYREYLKTRDPDYMFNDFEDIDYFVIYLLEDRLMHVEQLDRDLEHAFVRLPANEAVIRCIMSPAKTVKKPNPKKKPGKPKEPPTPFELELARLSYDERYHKNDAIARIAEDYQKETISININGNTQVLPAISYILYNNITGEEYRLFWAYGWGLVLQERLNETGETFIPFRTLTKCRCGEAVYNFTDIDVINE